MNDTRTVEQSTPPSPPEALSAPALPDDAERLEMIESAGLAIVGRMSPPSNVVYPESLSATSAAHHETSPFSSQSGRTAPLLSAPEGMLPVLHEETDAHGEASPISSEQDQLPDQNIQMEPAGQLSPLGAAPQATPSGDLLVLMGETWQPLSALIESLLFVADKPVEAGQIARTLNLNAETVEMALQRLADAYQHNGRGLRLQEQHNRWRLVTMPEAAVAVEAFLNLDMTTRLSTPALETLSVIAYRQPVTRPQIEAVRGVDCGAVLRSLIQRGLVEEVGRLESVGRPILYSVSEQFMHHFGLMSMRDLPPLEQPDEELLRSTSDLALV